MEPIIILAGLGFGVSWYAYIVERRIKTIPSYKPACDLSDIISCSKPIKSPYSQLFFVSNSILGMIFYALVIFLASINAWKLLSLAALGSCIASVILGYILYVKIKAVCLVCTTLYVLNFFIAFLAFRALYQ